MPRQLEQTPRCCCNKAFGGFPRASGSASACSTNAPLGQFFYVWALPRSRDLLQARLDGNRRNT